MVSHDLNTRKNYRFDKGLQAIFPRCIAGGLFLLLVPLANLYNFEEVVFA